MCRSKTGAQLSYCSFSFVRRGSEGLEEKKIKSQLQEQLLMWNKGVALFMQQHLVTVNIQLASNSFASSFKGVCERLDTWTARFHRGESFFFNRRPYKMEPNSPKKIQFAVPAFQSQLDPEASEQIRKRRPTPASLVILNENSPPEINDNRTTSTHEENVSPKQRKQSVYSGPTMKGGSEQAKPLLYTDDRHQSSSMSHQQTVTESTSLLLKPTRKDTPYHPDLPRFPGVTQIKNQKNSSFPEEEEQNDEDDECDH
ncbi:protein phosphatase 1 regulatory subunit 1C isoform X3 [Pseudophryne corroboree]|uniref:protein phosphatase 1 regulatory subunit 1C isoform X3 n=1 Tax=Pseudophryne corroboree TaxID=495146 RepID=UPI003082126A